MNEQRVGFYCWAGPGTERMINLKFFNPRIDHDSLMSSYDLDYLFELKTKFGVTDFWATYSWGFSPEVEAEDYKFLVDRAKNFESLGIRLHAYIQGPNVVYSQFPEKDWYCKDEKGRPITYYRGRRVVCLNNEKFRDFVCEKIRSMYGLGFYGIYMDNIQMGQLAIPTFNNDLPFVFAGCRCESCQKKYMSDTGEEIPGLIRDNDEWQRYLNWRVDVVTDFLTEVAGWVHAGGMVFGTNSFDPRFNTKYMFGTDLKKLDEIQDYFVFENHSLPTEDGHKSNFYIQKLINDLQIKKPVFVLSYRNGVGMEAEYSQGDFDNIYTEDVKYDFFSMYKGSEFVTEGVWHNLKLEKYRKPQLNPMMQFKKGQFEDKLEVMLLKVPLVKTFLARYYNQLTTWFLENRWGRVVLLWVYQKALK